MTLGRRKKKMSKNKEDEKKGEVIKPPKDEDGDMIKKGGFQPVKSEIDEDNPPKKTTG